MPVNVAHTGTTYQAGTFEKVVIADADPGAASVVPQGTNLAVSTFTREGADLLIDTPNGTKFVVAGYFALESPPFLVTEGGSVFPPDLVVQLAETRTPGQYAQSEFGVYAAPIGYVTSVEGEVTATKPDGTVVKMAMKAPLYQGDELETGINANVSLVFNDGSVFAVDEGSRIFFENFDYDGDTQEGKSLFSVVKGVLAFTSGDIAANNPEQMVIQTPVYTLEVRGTTGAIEVGSESDTISLLADADGTYGAMVMTNGAGRFVLDESTQTFRLTNSFTAPEAIDLSAGELSSLFGVALGALSATPSRSGTDSSSPAQTEEEIQNLADQGSKPDDADGSNEDRSNESEDVAVESSINIAPGFDAGALNNAADIEQPSLSPNAAPTQGAASTDRSSANVSGDSVGRSDDEMILVEIAEVVNDLVIGDEGSDEGAEAVDTGNDPVAPVLGQLITGGQESDQLFGAGGDDTIIGNAGDDLLMGEDGDDRLEGGAGDDQLIGGSGSGDVAVFLSDVRGYAIDLGAGTIVDTDLADGDAGRDTFSGIEVLEFRDRSVFLDGRGNTPLAFNDDLITDEDTPLVITAANLLSNDIEFDGESLSVTSVNSVVNGMVALQGSTIVFTPDTDFSGAASFDYTISDSAGTDTATVGITVNESNNAPIAIAINATTTEDSGQFSIDLLAGGFTSDADITDTLFITNVAQVLGRAISFNAMSGVVSFDPDQFTDLPQNTQESVQFTYTVDDGRGLPDSAATSTVTVIVEGFNDAPVVDLNGAGGGIDFAATFTEDAGAVGIVDATLTASDVDNANLASATVTITNQLDGVAEVLAANTAGTSIVAAYNSGTGVLSLTGADTVANYQQVLRTVTYDNSSQNPNTTDRTITFVANDGTANSLTATSTVTVSAVNDAPVVDLNGAGGGIDFAATFTEDAGAVGIVDATLTASDVDNANLASATVTITNQLDGAAEVLAANTAGTSIVAAYDSGTGVLSLTGADTVANYQMVLRTVTYDNSTVGANPTNRLVEFVVNDGTTNSVIAATTVIVPDVSGTAGNDSLVGSAAAESIAGLAGIDTIEGGGSNDTLDGGAGNDSLDGGTGDNFIFGGLGDDTLLGGAGNDTLEGGDGTDSLQIVGPGGAVNIDGGTENDTLVVTGANDTFDFTGPLSSASVDGIEEIDLTGTGNNTLILDVNDVIALTDGTNTLPDNPSFQNADTIVVTGNAGDTLTVTSANSFNSGVATDVDGQTGYTAFVEPVSGVTVVVDDDISFTPP